MKRSRPHSSEGAGSSTGSNLRRYGSDSHLNTPNFMMTPMGRSPGVRHSVVPNSSRRIKNENSIKVQEILEHDAQFYADLGLQNGLKSMTSKQFLMIIDYFIRSITGKEMTAMFGKGDPLDGIIKFLRDMGCPFIINKSMLKTPNAPHTFDQIVVLMLWLCDYISIPFAVSEVDGITDEEFIQDEQLPDHEYTAKFSKAMEKGFQLWNSESDEFDHLQHQLVDDFIGTKLHNKVTSTAELNRLTDKMQQKTKELQDHQMAIPDEEHLEKAMKQFTVYQATKESLKHEIDNLEKSVDAVHIIWNAKNDEFEQKQQMLEALKSRLANQRVTADEMQQLKFKNNKVKQAVSSFNLELEALRKDDSEVLTGRARLLQKLSGLIPAFNQHIEQIMKTVMKCGIEIDPKFMASLYLKPNPSCDQIDRINTKLGQFSSVVNENKTDTAMYNSKAKAEFELLEIKTKSLDTELKELEESHIVTSSKKQSIEKNILTIEKSLKDLKDAAAREMHKATTDHEELEGMIVESTNKIEELIKENSMIFDAGQKKLAEIFAAKQRILDELTDYEENLDEMLNKYNQY